MPTIFSVVTASFLVSLISLVGGVLLVWRGSQTDRFLTLLVSFAAGVMLAAAFLDLLPEALEAGEATNVFLPALVGIVSFFFLERFVLWFHHHDELHGTRPTVLLILFGDSLHNFIDGVAIAAAFLTNPSLGIATTFAIAAHEVPQEIADLSVLIYGGMRRGQALLYNFLSALTALIGAIGGFLLLETFQATLPILLAFTGGMFIYIACSDLIPELHKDFERQKSWLHSIPFIIGILVLWGFVRILEG